MESIPSIKAGKYRHKKNKKIYQVMYIAIDKNNDTQLQVIYKDTNNIYIREINDFANKFSVVDDGK